MPHTIEPALSGRAKCRGCTRPIAKGELRLGERLPNPFAEEGDMTIWFHIDCGAYKRPEAMLEALAACTQEVELADRLAEEARRSLEHRRLPRVDGAELASTGRAKCRSCREPIDKDTWRIRLSFFEDGRFAPSGFIHIACAEEYLGTRDLFDRLLHFSPELESEARAALERALEETPQRRGSGDPT